MSRPQGDHPARRDEIALAAAGVIASRGLAQVTLRDIAAALDVTTGVLTHYFPSKQALLRHTKELAFDRSLAKARAVSERETPSGIERLHAVVAAILPLDKERRAQWRLLLAFYGTTIGTPSARREQQRRMERWYALFHSVIAELMTNGSIPGGQDPARAGMAVALFVEGLAIQLVTTAPLPEAAWQLSFARDQVERLVGAGAPVARDGRA